MSSLHSLHRHLFRDFQFERLTSFHWSCFIVPSRLNICSFIAILVSLSLFHSICVQKKKEYIYIYIYI